MASNRRNLFWTLAHIGLGFICTITPFALIGWFYLILFGNITKSLSGLSKGKLPFFLMLFSYLVSFEVLDRMAETSPYIPYELGKYLLLVMGVLGLSYVGVRSRNGIIMVLLIIPALFYDFSGQRKYYDIINYFLGPLAVGLGIAFADRFQISKTMMNQILKFVFWACLSSLVYTVIRTPDFDNITFKLGANFETTAGHSSNQVSTVLGLGMFLSFYSFYNRLKFSGYRVLDGFIMAGFAFQGLLSFSRGGIVVGVLGILILVFLQEGKIKDHSNKKVRNNRPLMAMALAVVGMYFTFEIANNITGGNLLLRYQGHTQGTLLGSKEITADHFVTGRFGIFEQDLALWLQYPISGVGLGVSKYLRDLDRVGVAAHLELSRLLAEHGILGLIFSFLFFIKIPKDTWVLNKRSQYRNVLMAILAISIITTFHAAMRTFVTPLFLILGVLKVKNE